MAQRKAPPVLLPKCDLWASSPGIASLELLIRTTDPQIPSQTYWIKIFIFIKLPDTEYAHTFLRSIIQFSSVRALKSSLRVCFRDSEGPWKTLGRGRPSNPLPPPQHQNRVALVWFFKCGCSILNFKNVISHLENIWKLPLNVAIRTMMSLKAPWSASETAAWVSWWRDPYILGWPKSSFRFFPKILWENPNELFGHPNIFTLVLSGVLILNTLH